MTEDELREFSLKSQVFNIPLSQLEGTVANLVNHNLGLAAENQRLRGQVELYEQMNVILENIRCCYEKEKRMLREAVKKDANFNGDVFDALAKAATYGHQSEELRRIERSGEFEISVWYQQYQILKSSLENIADSEAERIDDRSLSPIDEVRFSPNVENNHSPRMSPYHTQNSVGESSVCSDLEDQISDNERPSSDAMDLSPLSTFGHSFPRASPILADAQTDAVATKTQSIKKPTSPKTILMQKVLQERFFNESQEINSGSDSYDGQSDPHRQIESNSSFPPNSAEMIDSASTRQPIENYNTTGVFSIKRLKSRIIRKPLGRPPKKFCPSTELLCCQFNGCEFKTRYRSALTVHTYLHTGEKPYKCRWHQCGKSFTTIGSLHDHENVHTGFRPYVCTWENCGKRFKSQGNLCRHRKVHEEAKLLFESATQETIQF